MNFICPVCSSKCTFDQAARDDLMRELVHLAAFFGSSWELVNEYVDCHRADQWGSVTAKRRTRLLGDLKRLFTAASIEVDGRRYRAEKRSILVAMRAVCDAEKYGFRNHNYLKKVIVTGGAERVSAEGKTAKEETAIEKERRETRDERRETITAAEFKKRHRGESLAAGVGREM